MPERATFYQKRTADSRGDRPVVKRKTGSWIWKAWSSSEYNNNNAWVFCTNNGADWGGVNNNNKDNNNSKYVVRPVLAFLARMFFW